MIVKNPRLTLPLAQEPGSDRPHGETGGSGVRGVVGHSGGLLDAGWQDVLSGSARWAVVQGDCLDVMREMPDGCVDAVVTDPPYGVDYAGWDASIPPQEVLDNCLRISRGPVIWFGAGRADVLLETSKYRPRPDRLLVWAPGFSLAMSRDSRVFYRFHPIWCWRLPDSSGAVDCDVLRDNCEGAHWWNHPATKPLSLMKRLVDAFVPEGGTVLDCYAGSGTTGVACQYPPRRFIGIERETAYCDIARARIEPKGVLL